MANVQPEHGYTRLANQLLEAAALAPFSVTQYKILLALVRLTYGWNHSTAAVSTVELAAAGGMDAASGSWLRAWRDLRAAGVVVTVIPSSGRSPGLYMIGKNFEQWGPFSVAPGKLASMYASPPESDDQTARDMGLVGLEDVEREPRRLALVGDPSKNMSAPAGNPTQRRLAPAGNPGTQPLEASLRTSQPLRADTSSPYGLGSIPEPNGSKELSPSERQLKTVVPQQQPAATTESPKVDTANSYAVGMTSALNIAAVERWKSGLVCTPASSLDAAEQLHREGVPLEFARSVIADRVKASKAAKPIRTAAYFLDAIRDEWARHNQAEHDRTAPRPATIGTPNGAGRPIDSTEATRTAEADDRERAGAYDIARKRAASAWVAQHPDDAHQLVEAIRARHTDLPDGGFRNATLRAEQLVAFADAAGFPAFDQWAPDTPTP